MGVTSPFHLLMVHSPAFPSQAHINPGTAIPPLGFRNLPDPRPQGGILLTPTAVPQRVPIQFEQPTDPSLTQPKALGHPLRRRSLRLGPYQFFAVTAFSA